MSRIPWWALALAVLFVVAVPGGAAVAFLAMSQEQRRVRQAARTAAAAYGIRPELLEALGYVESRWRMSAVNKSGADGARGGSWGPFQLSETTARAYGYRDPMELLTTDAEVAAAWAAKVLAARPGGPPQTIEDASAWWNAGRTSFAGLGPDHVTRVDYVPKARAALDLVQSNPLPAAEVA